MCFKLDSNVAITYSVVFQPPSTFGPGLEQSFDISFSLPERST